MKKYALYLLIILGLSAELIAEGVDKRLPLEEEGISKRFVNYNKSNANDMVKDFIKENGEWSFKFDGLLKTPHFAYGKPIDLVISDMENEAEVSRLAMDFLVRYEKTFNIDVTELKLSRVAKVRDNWYINYKQFVGSIEVLGSGVELKINSKGELFNFEVEFYNFNIESLKAEYSYKDLANSIKGRLKLKSIPTLLSDNENKYYLPIRGNNTLNMDLVHKIRYKTEGSYEINNAYISAIHGEIVWNQSLTHDVDVEVGGDVEMVNYHTLPEYKKMTNMKVNIGGEEYLIDKDGKLDVDITEETEVDFLFEGPWAKVIWDNKQPTVVESSISEGESKIVLDDENSHQWERNQFFYLNFIHDYVKDLDSEFDAMDTLITVTMMTNPGPQFGDSPNAYSNYDSIVFVNPDHPEIGMANGPSILYHEYGHSMHNLFYIQQGAAEEGMLNRACHEGTADVLSALIVDNPKIGYGQFRNDINQVVRNIDNDNIFPDSIMGESHHDGLIIAGAFWDLRELIGIEATMDIFHFAKYGLPDDIDDKTAFMEWFLESVIADDDDGDLSNGTPHLDEIIEAFNLHKIGTNLLLEDSFYHSPLSDSEDMDKDFDLSFTMTAPEFPGMSFSNARMHYSVNDGVTYEVVDATSDGDEFFSTIPAPNMAVKLKYYFTINDDLAGQVMKFPNIEGKTYQFLVGFKTIYRDDFEGVKNWTLSDDNTVASGKWEINEPELVDLTALGMPLVLQPEGGNSEDGGKCLVTDGSAGFGFEFFQRGSGYGVNTVESKVIDISEFDENLMLSFDYWFNGLSFMSPSIESVTFKMEYSTDGENWKLLFDGFELGEDWVNETILLSDDIAVNDELYLKFNLSNLVSDGQIIEGLIDNIKVMSPAKQGKSVGFSNSGLKIIQNGSTIVISSDELFKENMSYQIIDMQGKELMGLTGISSLGRNNIEINLGNDIGNGEISSGVYLFKLVYRNERKVKKINIDF